MGFVMPLNPLFAVVFGLIAVVNSKRNTPHILFILADDLGFNDIGYHNSKIKTENLDELARNGVRLENYYVQPVCSPTRADLLTGRYSIHTGFQRGIIWPSQANALPKNETTIADKLKEVGYRTHIVGKWHLGFYRREFIPTHRGFDSFYGFLTGGEDYYTHKNSLGYHKPGFTRMDGYDFWRNEEVVKDVVGEYSTFLFAEEAKRIIEEHDSKTPLFLYLSFQAPHMPLQVPKRFIERYRNIKDRKRRIYAAMVSCLDEAVGNVTRLLKKRGLWKNTVLVFSSDNGGQPMGGGNNWPLRGLKGSLWEGGIRAVGFVNGQLIAKPKRIHRGLMHVSDWFPTFAHLASASLDGLSLDGVNQWESISKGTPSLRKEILHNMDCKKTSQDSVKCKAAFRLGDWKLLLGRRGNDSRIPAPEMDIPIISSYKADTENEISLFNITKDPEELEEISRQHPDVVQDLLARIRMYETTAVPARYPAPDPRSEPLRHGGIWKPWMD